MTATTRSSTTTTTMRTAHTSALSCFLLTLCWLQSPHRTRAFLLPGKGGGRGVTFHRAATQAQWADVQEFNVALDRLAEYCGSPGYDVVDMATRCQDMMNTQAGNVTPDTVSFNTVLKAWSKCSGVMAEGSWNRSPTNPDVPVYTARDAAERATSLLFAQEKMQEEAGDDDKSIIHVDTTSYNIVIDAWAKSCVNDAPQAAERLLRRMKTGGNCEPDSITYHGLLDAWVCSGKEETGIKIRQIYEHMKALHEEGENVKPTARTINTLIHGHARMVSYYISRRNNFEQDRALECALEAEKIFNEAIEEYERTGDPDLQPDTTTYSSLIDALCRCGTWEATLKAERVLQDLKAAYAKTGSPQLRPNFRTYTSLVAGWSRTRSGESPKKVEALLKEMETSELTRPNARTYTSVIQCWGRSRDSSKARKALQILRDLKEKFAQTDSEDIRPTIMTYNAVIDTCARCQGTIEAQTEALRIAFAVMKAAEQDEGVEVNQTTLYTLINAAGYLLPPGAERNKIAGAVFEKAKTLGLVEPITLTNLRKALDADVYAKTLDLKNNQQDIRIGDLPPSWSANTRRP